MKSKFSFSQYDEMWAEIVKNADHKILAMWAIDCTERVMPYFERAYPDDLRPRQAIQTLQVWLKTGVFSMALIRKASLSSHAAARDVGNDNSARSAASAAGQAVATAHVPAHSIAAANYAAQAVYRASASGDTVTSVTAERAWQHSRLQKYLSK